MLTLGFFCRNFSTRAGLRYKPWVRPSGCDKHLGHMRFQIKTNFFLKHAEFKTSAKYHAAPLFGPLLLKLSTGLSRVIAIFAGRYARRWWKNLSPKEKLKVADLIRKNRTSIILGGSVSTCSLIGYYLCNLEDVPLTGRKRFRVISKDQVMELAEDQGKHILQDFAENSLNPDSTYYKKVHQVVNNLLKSNGDITEIVCLPWQINVLESKDMNAFVLPTGQIFVMTGMLDLLESEDELAGILGHEIAHVLLEHTAEQLSFSAYFSIISLAVIASVWAVAPTDMLAAVSHWLQSHLQNILVHMPYSRKLEKEADYVGLLLAAKSCYDVRKVASFWKRMSTQNVEDKPHEVVEWLSTHPTHANRAEWVTTNLPEALAARKRMNCPRLDDFFRLSTMV